MRVTGRYVCRLMVAIVACVASAATVRAADIRGTMEGKVTPYKGGGTVGSFGFVLEGNIEPGDYDKLKSVYGDVRANQFFLGSLRANELYLASRGGDLAEAMKIGRLVRALKLHTVVPSRSDPNTFDAMVTEHNLRDPKANYMCASACFFIFVAGVERTSDFWNDAILGVHRPYLSAADLRAQTGDQAVTSANQLRTFVENYLKEMDVPTKYSDLMFSTPKDKVLWVGDADFKADLEGVIPALRDWLAARCDKRTDVEKAMWENMMVDRRPMSQQSAAERSIFEMMQKKMRDVRDCDRETLDKLSADAWLKMFDPACTIIAPEAREVCHSQK